MAEVSRTEVFDVNIEKFYQVIVNYEAYPEFVDGVSDIEVLENNDQGARVRYGLNLIKKFSYIIGLKHDKPNKVSWSLESGDIFKKNNGSWELKKLDENKTEVTYNLDVEFKVMAPKMIVNKLVTTNLPNMMKAYCQRANNL